MNVAKNPTFHLDGGIRNYVYYFCSKITSLTFELNTKTLKTKHFWVTFGMVHNLFTFFTWNFNEFKLQKAKKEYNDHLISTF